MRVIDLGSCFGRFSERLYRNRITCIDLISVLSYHVFSLNQRSRNVITYGPLPSSSLNESNKLKPLTKDIGHPTPPRS